MPDSIITSDPATRHASPHPPSPACLFAASAANRTERTTAHVGAHGRAEGRLKDAERARQLAYIDAELARGDRDPKDIDMLRRRRGELLGRRDR